MSSVSHQAANADPLNRFWHDSLEDADPEVASIIGREKDVEPSVGICVEQRHTANHRFQKVLLPGLARLVSILHAARCRYVGECQRN